MTREKNDGGPTRLTLAPEPEAESGSIVTGQIQRYVRSTENVLHSLKKELESYRTHNSQLIKERNEQLRMLAHVERDRGNRSDLQEELRLLRKERNRTTNALGSLQDENQRLGEQCTLLEEELANQRRRYLEAQEIIAYFEVQFEEVERVIQLLKVHAEFMVGLGDDSESAP